MELLALIAVFVAGYYLGKSNGKLAANQEAIAVGSWVKLTRAFKVLRIGAKLLRDRGMEYIDAAGGVRWFGVRCFPGFSRRDRSP
jgi:hypothetical protein